MKSDLYFRSHSREEQEGKARAEGVCLEQRLSGRKYTQRNAQNRLMRRTTQAGCGRAFLKSQTWEAEAGRFQVQGQPVLQSETSLTVPYCSYREPEVDSSTPIRKLTTAVTAAQGDPISLASSDTCAIVHITLTHTHIKIININIIKKIRIQSEALLGL